MEAETRRLLEFGDFRLDLDEHRLLRCDGAERSLRRRLFETLRYLVEHAGQVLDKEVIMEAVWPDCVVEENNLAQNISTLRRIFGDTPASQNYIVTVPGRGYRFVPQVKVAENSVLNTSVESTTTTPAPMGDNAQTDSSSKRLLSRSIVGAGLILLALSIVLLFFLRSGAPHLFRRPAGIATAAGAIPEKSVAVLPFENLSDDKQNAYFAAGVQEEILSNLARIADLKVISRTSANQYNRGNGRNSRKIGEQLGVAHLLEGSVQRIGNRLRVHAQLIDTHTDAHMWAQTYERDVADLFAIQGEIAQTIAEQLHAKISPEEKLDIERPLTRDLTAFELYMRSKDISLLAMSRNTAKADLLAAADLLDRAIARDPAFFHAYCELAWIHDLLYFLGFDHTPRRLALAEATIQAALRLRPEAGEGHLARAGNLYRGYLDYGGALVELDAARQTLPNDARLFELKGYIERRQGKPEEALRSLERAAELDPRNIYILQQIAASYRYLRRYAEAKLAYDRALAVDPNDIETKAARALVELEWKADTGPLHQLIDSLRVTNPSALPNIADTWLLCALAERDVVAAKDAMTAAGQNPPISNEAVHFNRLFVEGVIARMTKDDHKARLAFAAARVEQEKIVQTQPNYGPPLCVLGLIDAALGRKDEALREGRRAVELLPVEKDALNGPPMLEYSAMIAAWLGEKDIACKQLADAIRWPGLLSYGELKLFALWDPLRGNPRFEQIVASLAPKVD